jgi:hypothetical protein
MGGLVKAAASRALPVRRTSNTLLRQTGNEEQGMFEIPPDAVSLRLARIVGDDLRLCETVRFRDGHDGVETVLRRAAISGRVEIGVEVGDYFADALDDNNDIVETIALDAKSYSKLKNRWMRCRLA